MEMLSSFFCNLCLLVGTLMSCCVSLLLQFSRLGIRVLPLIFCRNLLCGVCVFCTWCWGCFWLVSCYLFYIVYIFYNITALLEVEDRERLLKEVTLMLTFSHPNVMPLIGLCLDQETPLIIMPFMSKGNLLQYVREHRVNLYLTESGDINQVAIAHIGRYIVIM